MLEVTNALPIGRLNEIDHFLTYLGIYEDAKRTHALKRLILNNAGAIKGKVCVEAGSGLGEITELLLKAKPKRLFCVEENGLCCEYLKKRFRNNRPVEIINTKIEAFKPDMKIDFLFHELYGPLLLDESLLALSRLKFKPAVVAPDSGCLVMETAGLKGLRDPGIDRQILGLLDGALVSDLFIGYKFKKPEQILKWEFGKTVKPAAQARVKSGDVLVMGMEIWHEDRRICGTAECENWPYIFTPIKAKTFKLEFLYRNCYSDIRFKWL